MTGHTESPFKGKTGLRRLINALGYSLDGLGAAFRHEAAFRQLSLLAAVLLPLAIWLPVTPIERALMMAAPLATLIIELLNSAIEAAVRTASRNIKLSTEAYMTISTLAGFNKNADSVCKHNLSSILYLNYVNCLELTFTN
jgi:diacylglycerol kinase